MCCSGVFSRTGDPVNHSLMVLKRDSPNLDILRSFAVLAVLINHLAQITPRGQQGGRFALDAIGGAGVLVFFVHTALVLMGSLERLETKSYGWRLLSAFYIQRLFRIYPLSITCVTAVVLAHIAAPELHVNWLNVRAVFANLTLVQNLTRDPNVISPLWSLPYEVQMYFFLPFIYSLTKHRNALLLIAALWILAVLGSLVFTAGRPNAEIPPPYRLLSFVPTFLGGVFAFVLTRKRHANLPAALWPFSVLAIFLAFQLFPVPCAEIAMTLLGFVIPQFAEMENAVTRTIAHNIAKYSYGIYLMHVPLLEVCFVHLHTPGVLFRSVLFLLLLTICSVGAYHIVEKPLIDLGHRISRRLTIDAATLTHAKASGGTAIKQA